MSDYQLAHKSYKEEKKAVHDYKERREESKDPELKRHFTHARNEEKDHARDFKKSMNKNRGNEHPVNWRKD